MVALGVLAALVILSPLAVALLRDDSPGGGAQDRARTAQRPAAPPRKGAPPNRGAVASATASGGTSAPSPLRPASSRFPDAAGTARIVGAGPARRVALSFKNLIAPKGNYVLWLYNDRSDALSFARFSVRAERLTVTLPPNANRFRYIDLSDESQDGGRGHDGVSVLRGLRPQDPPAKPGG